MSTIKVNRIENTSTTDGGVSIDVDGHVTIDGQQLPTAGPLSNRNLIINGAMQVAQRGTSFSMSTTSGFCTDRFKAVPGSSFDWQSTLTQESDGPDGFGKSLKVNVDTASTPTGSENAVLYYRFEGQDCQQLGFGTASAKTTTLSFWVKSNKTGTYSVQFANNSPARYVLVEYTVDTADTWEYKTITFLGDTSTDVDDDNGTGLDLRWNLAAGPDDLTTPVNSNTWSTAVAGIAASNDQVNLMDAVNNYWQITGVQLEVGSKATPFEHESYGQTLAKCQRYYQKITSPGVDSRVGIGQAVNSDGADVFIKFVCEMRTAPTAIEQSGTPSDYGVVSAIGGGGDCTSVPSFRFANSQGITIRFTDTGHLSAGNATQAYLDTANAFLAWSAEL